MDHSKKNSPELNQPILANRIQSVNDRHVHIGGRASAKQTKVFETFDATRETAADFKAGYRIANQMSSLEPVVEQLTSELEIRWGAECGYVGVMIVALQEAVSNAVCHGNLELTRVAGDRNAATYHDLAAERRTNIPWCERQVHIRAEVSARCVVLQVTDEGRGFDESDLEESATGGIHLMKALMDKVEFSLNGRRVTMTLWNHLM